MLSMDRRRFLGVLGAATLLPKFALGKTLLSPAPALSRDTFLLLYMEDNHPNYHLLAVDAEGKNWRKYELPFAAGIDGAHSIEVNPQDPSELAIFPRAGKSMVFFSLREGKVVREIPAKPGFEFSGHGLISPSGKEYLASEKKLHDELQGFVSIRDVKTGALLDEINTGAKWPHQMAALDPEMKTMAVTHFGVEYDFKPIDVQSEVTIIDVKSKEIKKRFRYTPNLNAEMAHIVANPLKPGEFFVASQDLIRTGKYDQSKNVYESMRFRPSPVFWATPESKELHEMDAAGKSGLFTFNFSMAISAKHRTVGAVQQTTGYTSFWDTRTKKLRKMIYHSKDTEGFTLGLGTTTSGDEFFLTISGTKGSASRLIFIDAQKLEVSRTLKIPAPGKFGAHINRSSFSA